VRHALDSPHGSSPNSKGSGVPLFDDLLAGTLPEASTLALIGSIGTGTSIICTSFIAQALKKGRKVLFVIGDYDLALSKRYFASIGFDIKSYIDDGNLIMTTGDELTYAKIGVSRSYDIENLRPLTSNEIIDTFQKEVLDRYKIPPKQPVMYVIVSLTSDLPIIWPRKSAAA
jgi:KaiC/GvpD/RAD55 family RecA-like ATPase